MKNSNPRFTRKSGRFNLIRTRSSKKSGKLLKANLGRGAHNEGTGSVPAEEFEGRHEGRSFKSLALLHASQLVALSGPTCPHVGKDLSELGIIHDVGARIRYIRHY